MAEGGEDTSLPRIIELLQGASTIGSRDGDSPSLEDLDLEAPSLAAAGGGSMSELLDALKAAEGGPTEEVKSGRVPLPQNVGVLPGYDDASAVQSYGHLVDLSSLVALYTVVQNASFREKRGRSEPYDITIASEAAQAFADMANASYQIMTGPLAGFFNFQSGTVQTMSRSMSKTEVHLEFLAELFKGFSLTKPAMLQIDTILTKFIQSLGTISVEKASTSQSVDHTLRINQVLRLNISGDDSNPIWVYQPRTRIVYMHIDAGTYKWATNKASHESSTFNMRYVVADCDLNVNKYLAAKPKLDKIFTNLVGKNLKEYGELINSAPVKESA